MNPEFVDYVKGFADQLASGRQLAALHCVMPSLPDPAPDAPVCLVFSPHPDDEAISGALPWRLRSEAGWRVVNVAVTLGSHRQRRSERWQELRRSCSCLGFELISASGDPGKPFEGISPQAQSHDPRWAAWAATVAALLDKYRPSIVVCPHALDGHPAHMGTYCLVRDALQRSSSSPGLHLLLSEYWNTQLHPALMLELGHQHVARLMSALCMHAGEVARNAYHLTLPAWFMDGVRRGAERVGAAGSSAPDFSFAALYGWQRWQDGVLLQMPALVLSLNEPIDAPFA